ncbi:MAG: hypothetical protein N2Z74_02020 [Syntrophales bacterium]|nr:hypothetical protein [Syntrophales bacterium]
MMAKRLPDYQEKQQILYRDGHDRAEWIRYGDAFFNAGRIFDALDFYQRAVYTEGLEKLKAMAERQGDAMLFQAAMKALGRSITPKEWEGVAIRAQELGKVTFSRYALGQKEKTEQTGKSTHHQQKGETGH